MKVFELQKNVIAVLAFVYAACFLASPVEASFPQEYSITTLLPVNVSLPEGQRVNLKVEIPKGFKCLQNDTRNSQMLEFIPETDKDSYKWSEIITTHNFVGQRIKSNQVIEVIAAGIKERAKNIKILQKSSDDFKAYTTASSIISYTFNNRNELLYMKYFSGPYDCSGFQYAMVITDQMTEAKALEKIKEFEKTQIAVVQF